MPVPSEGGIEPEAYPFITGQGLDRIAKGLLTRNIE